PPPDPRRRRGRGRAGGARAAWRSLWRPAPEKSTLTAKEARMAHWLMKSEPHVYSWDDLVRDRGTEWDGVRNNAARLHLRAMKPGDEAFFYHSRSDKAVVGIMRVTRGAEPDPKAP